MKAFKSIEEFEEYIREAEWSEITERCKELASVEILCERYGPAHIHTKCYFLFKCDGFVAALRHDTGSICADYDYIQYIDESGGDTSDFGLFIDYVLGGIFGSEGVIVVETDKKHWDIRVEDHIHNETKYYKLYSALFKSQDELKEFLKELSPNEFDKFLTTRCKKIAEIVTVCQKCRREGKSHLKYDTLYHYYGSIIRTHDEENPCQEYKRTFEVYEYWAGYEGHIQRFIMDITGYGQVGLEFIPVTETDQWDVKITNYIKNITKYYIIKRR